MASSPGRVPDALRQQLQASLGPAYAIERELGGGGMSRVFVAEETRFHRRVVIKVLAPELAAELSVERFEREIALAAALQEPHIVAVITAGEVMGLPWYTMPFVEGDSLRALIDRGAVQPDEALTILRDMAKALVYAHDRGIVHRDIKPDNVLLSSGTAVVTDFGIAKALRASRTVVSSGFEAAALTQTGMSLGTPAYMAPEQAAGDEVDARADIYSWGVVAYELLAGRHPFAGRTTAQQLVAAHVSETPTPLGAVSPSTAPAVADLVSRALAKDPDHRPASARMLLDVLDGLSTAGSGLRTTHRPSRRRAAIVAASVLAVVSGALLWVSGARTTGLETGTAALSTVAVLPFVNVGRNVNEEYFSDGMTDELARALASLPGIRVAGRSSSYAFKGKNLPGSEIGRALHVAGLVQGTVLRAGDRLRVTAQLTSAANDSVVWSAKYDHAVGDMFAVQDKVTQAIVGALAPALRGERAGDIPVTRRGTADTAAYDMYLRGQYLWKRRGVENLATAADFFRRAVARDPRFARGHSGLALTLAILPFYTTANPDSLARLGLASAERAIALDSSLGEAHLARGRALHDLLRIPDARAEYARALALDPRSASALQWLAELDYNAGHAEAGIAAERRAQELDPLSPLAAWLVARQLLGIGRVAEAVAEARRARDMDPSLTRVHVAYGTALVLAGQLDSALVELEGAHQRTPDEPGVVAHLAYAYAAAGRWADVDRLGAELTARGYGRAVHAERAAIAVLDGNRDGAIRELERSIERHDLIGVSVFPACDPLWVPLRDDPRFRALLSHLAIAPCPARLAWPVSARVRPPFGR